MKKKIVYVLSILILAYYISQNYLQLMIIQGASMEPTYHNMQLVYIKKNYDASDLKPGETIAFRCDKLNGVLVKRIVAVPGQMVIIKDKTLWINNTSTPFYNKGDFEYAGILAKGEHLGEDEFVVIGDNLSKSKDSRYEEVGIIKRDKIIGIVING